MKRRLAIAITVGLSIVVGFLMPFLIAALTVGAVFAFPLAEPAPAPEAEYYRGMYDACAAMTRQPARCLKTIEQSRDNDWYGQPSPGWEWPISPGMPAPGQDPAGQRLNG